MTNKTFDELFVVLPDGRLDRDGARFIGDDVAIESVELPIISSNQDVQMRYEQMRLAGESHNLAEIFATKRFCGVKSDSIFNEGRFSGSSLDHCPAHEKWLRAQAEAAGVSTTGKYYLAGLADFPGDPTAWVDGRGDILRVCEAKGMSIKDGFLSYRAPESEPVPDVQIADDIVEREVNRTLAECPGARREDIREAVYNLRSGKEDDHPLLVNDYTEADIAATV
jgi:hypothetical protein